MQEYRMLGKRYRLNSKKEIRMMHKINPQNKLPKLKLKI